METSNPFRRQLPPADRGLRSLEKDDPIFTTSSSCASKIGKGRDEENATVLTGATAGDGNHLRESLVCCSIPADEG